MMFALDKLFAYFMVLFCASILLVAGPARGHTEEGQFFGDQIPDMSLPWWEIHDYYAWAVGVDGDTAVVSARHEGVGKTNGAVYVYVRDEFGAWAEQQKILNPGGMAEFGRDVDISGDTLVITALRLGDYQGEGYAWIYKRTGTVWVEEQELFGGSNDMDGFGYAAAIDGDSVAITAWHDDDMGGNAGAVHVFVRSGSTWSREAKLYPTDIVINDHFGRTVDLEGDTLVVNSMGLDANGAYGGNAYVFVREAGEWVEQIKLEASDQSGGDNMGVSLSLNRDTLIAGSFDNAPGASLAGAAYVFQRDGCDWTEQAKLVPPASERVGGMWFGQHLAVQGDVALVGAPYADEAGDQSGTAYVFERSGETWTMDSKVTPADAASNQRIGSAIDLHNDRAVIGARQDYQGKVYMFDLDTDNIAAAPQTAICFDGCHP